MGLFDRLFGGLFADEKKTTVGTSVARVIQDDSLPDAIKTGIVKSIFESGDIPEYAMEELVGSVGVRAERMYEYGRNGYIFGLPSGQFLSATAGVPEATAILSAVEGTAVTPIYTRYGAPNKLHIGWLKLTTQHGYSQETNRLGNLSNSMGVPVYLEDMEVVIPEADFPLYEANVLEQWGTPATAGYTPTRTYQATIGSMRAHTPIKLDPVATEPYVRVTYVWLDPTDPEALLRSTFNISVSEYDTTLDYFHAKYMVGGVTKYWMYQDSAGTYPTLDNVFNKPPSVNGTFFPIAYFRYDKVSQNTDTSSAAYKSSKKLVKYLGMDFSTVADAVNSNPGINDVEQAMMIMAVPANTSNELERRYLFKFFENLHYAGDLKLTSVAQASIAATQSGETRSSYSALVIQDARFKMVLSNSGTIKRRKRGVIAAKGKHDSGRGTYTGAAVTVTDVDGITTTTQTQESYHYYRKQITANLYDEIWVINPVMQYYIYEGRFVTADEADPILLIPLDYSITSTFSIQDREILYSRGMHYVFNSRVTQSIKWYQQGWFGTLMQIVAIVVIVYSLGSATGPVASLMTAIATGSTVLINAAVIAVIQHLLIGMVIGFAFKLFVKAVGPELAIAVAVIAAAYGAYQIYDAGSVAGAPWAKELLQVSTGLSNGAQEVMKDMYGGLLDEYQSFNLFKDESTKSLEAANKLLENNNWLSPFVIFGEKPDDYYNRTIHAGNVGVLGIGAISQYVDTALTLPKLDETIEG